MRVITLLCQKGGSGKSTLSVHLAVAFHREGQNVLVLDLDGQASATEWHDAREEKLPHVESIQPSRLEVATAHARKIGTDILILDTAPHSETTALDAARMSDLILVPCQPSIVDIRAMKKTVNLLRLVQAPAFAIINGIFHNSKSTATEAERTISRHLKLPVCPVMIAHRITYSRSMITGLTALETDPDGKAAKEIRQLYKWTAAQLEQRKAA